MKIVVIDGMGGGLGKAIIERIKPEMQNCEIYAVGTNAVATSAMMKAGASFGATGENAIIFNCRQADFIIGTIGIVLTDSMLGEISEKISAAVISSSAQKILIPNSKCRTHIVGVSDKPIAQYIDEIPTIINKLS